MNEWSTVVYLIGVYARCLCHNIDCSQKPITGHAQTQSHGDCSTTWATVGHTTTALQITISPFRIFSRIFLSSVAIPCFHVFPHTCFSFSKLCLFPFFVSVFFLSKFALSFPNPRFVSLSPRCVDFDILVVHVCFCSALFCWWSFKALISWAIEPHTNLKAVRGSSSLLGY